MTRLVLPCHCVVMLDDHFTHGQRRVVCEGDDPARRDRRYPGGRGYLVSAEVVSTVIHTVKPLPASIAEPT